MFFLFPAIVLILVFFLLPFIGKKREPFGYRTDVPVEQEKFNNIKNVYHRKVFLFSIPLTVAMSVSNIYILSTFLGSFLLGAFILVLGGINFLFYLQGYKAVKAALAEDQQPPSEDETPEKEKEELPQW
jgi:hypothetical protein